jgi:hypothetical protein
VQPEPDNAKSPEEPEAGTWEQPNDATEPAILGRLDEIAAESRAAIERADAMIENVAQPKPSEPESVEVILTRLGASGFDVEAIRAHADRQAAEIERRARIKQVEADKDLVWQHWRNTLEMDIEVLLDGFDARLAELKNNGAENE